MKDMYDDKDLQKLYNERYFANRSRPPMWIRRAEFIVEKFNPKTFLDIGFLMKKYLMFVAQQKKQILLL